MESSAHRVAVMLVAEGEVSIDPGKRVEVLASGSMFVIGPGDQVPLTSRTDLALYEVVSDPQGIGLPLLELESTAGPFSTSEAVWLSLTTVLNQLLGSSVELPGTTVRALGRAVESLVLAALYSSPEIESSNDASESSLLALARRLIDVHASDPTFSATELAEVSNISRAHLYRLFASENTTPLASIRAARAELARRQLQHAAVVDGQTLLRVAVASGFRTVAAMQRALSEVARG